MTKSFTVLYQGLQLTGITEEGEGKKENDINSRRI